MGLLLTWLTAIGLAAEPLLVPPFTPETDADFPISVMLDGLVYDRLIEDGHIVLNQDVVSRVIPPEEIANCSLNPSCPASVLPRLPTRVAVVVSVGHQSGTLLGHLELYEQSLATPVDVRSVPISPGNEAAFADEVASAVQSLLTSIGPSNEAVLLAAARLIAGQDMGTLPADPSPAVPPPGPMPIPPPAPVAEPTPAPRPVANVDNRGELPEGVAPRHLLGSEAHFRKSGLDARDWLYKAMPHAGRFTMEIRAGLGMGDVDRSADVRVTIVEGNQEASWYQEGPRSARRVRGGLYLGYAPTTFLDLGAVFGLQYGGRILSTGWARVRPDRDVQKRTSPDEEVQALQPYIQPRVRGYIVPVGPAKPFVFTGMDVRFMDQYRIQQPATLEYPNPPAGVVPGWVGGGGIMIDPGPIVGFFFEASYIQHFGTRSAAIEWGSWEYRRPEAPVGTPGAFTAAVNGGIQFRL